MRHIAFLAVAALVLVSAPAHAGEWLGRPLMGYETCDSNNGLKQQILILQQEKADLERRVSELEKLVPKDKRRTY